MKNKFRFAIFSILFIGVSTTAVFIFNFSRKNEGRVEAEPVIEQKEEKIEIPDTILNFTGDVSLADNWHIAPKYDERGGISGIMDESVLDLFKSDGLTVVNSEFTVSNREAALPNKLYTFRAKPERLAIYHEMSVELALLANNHVYDYGEEAFLDMLEAFEAQKIPYIGAGRNLDEARRIFYFESNGRKIAFVNATRAEKNIMTPGAGENSPGVFRCYDPTLFAETISEARENADFVVAIVHWGIEGSHGLEQVQIDTAKTYIDAGADVIVGHHAHVLQGIGFYKGKPIVYNLGNFLFNQESLDTGVFQVKLVENVDGSGSSSMNESDNRSFHAEYYFLPAYQENMSVKLLEGSERQRVIDEMNGWSTNATIDASGRILEKL